MTPVRIAVSFAAWILLLSGLAPAPSSATTIELSPIDQGSIERRANRFSSRFLHDPSATTVAPTSTLGIENVDTTNGYLIFDVSGISGLVDDVTLALFVGQSNGGTLIVSDVLATTDAFQVSFDVTESNEAPLSNARFLMQDLERGTLATTSLAGLESGDVAVAALGPGGVSAVSVAQGGNGQVAFGLRVFGVGLGTTQLNVLGAILFVTTVPEPGLIVLLIACAPLALGAARRHA